MNIELYIKITGMLNSVAQTSMLERQHILMVDDTYGSRLSVTTNHGLHNIITISGRTSFTYSANSKIFY